MNPRTVQETAELFWLCLERQQNIIGPWEQFKLIPSILQRIAPLRRRITYRSPEPGVRLVCTMRVYDAEAAKALCAALEYNPVQSLSRGYKVAQNEFYEAVQRYFEYRTACMYYA